jgi:hypothetical protein
LLTGRQIESRGLLLANHSTASNCQGTGFPVKKDLPSIEQTARRDHIGTAKTHRSSEGEAMFEQSSPRNFKECGNKTVLVAVNNNDGE